MRKMHDLQQFTPTKRPDGSSFLSDDGESLNYCTLFRDAAFFHQQHRRLLGYQLSLVATMNYQHADPSGFVPSLQVHEAEPMMLVFDTRNAHEGWYRYHVAAGYGTKQYTLAIGEHGMGFGKAYERTSQNVLSTDMLLDSPQAVALMGMITMKTHPLTTRHLRNEHSRAENASDEYDKQAETIQSGAPVEAWVGLGEQRRERFFTEASWAANFGS